MSDETPTHRFIPISDIILLREVAAVDVQAYANGLDWGAITENLNTGLENHGLEGRVNERQVKDRKSRLVKAFRADNLSSLKASGTNEQYREREKLLQEIVDKEDEVAKGKEDKKKNGEKSNKLKENQGLKVRDAAMKTLKAAKMPTLIAEAVSDASDFEEVDSEEDQEPRRKRRRNDKQDNQNKLLGILKERNELQKKELTLMGKKFEAETEERKGLLELMRAIVEKQKPI